MNQRLQQFLAAENISQSQFADSIGVARASVSHILAGRNKPGFDFIEKMSKHYPTLNLEWLIKGKGKMYSSKNVAVPAPIDESTAEFPTAENIDSELLFDNAPKEKPVERPQVSPVGFIAQSSKSSPIDPKGKSVMIQRNISKVIILFDDGSYQEMVGTD